MKIQLYIFFIIFILSSCKSQDSLKMIDVNTEIICKDRPNILIKYITAKELSEAIAKSYAEYGQNITSTPIVTSDHRSFIINNISPKEVTFCILKETRSGYAEKNYIHSPN